MKTARIFLPLTKVDEVQRLVYAEAASEATDKTNEKFDYATSKPLFENWSNQQSAATKAAGTQISYGNVREMHGKSAAGRLDQPIDFSDSGKTVSTVIKVVDDDAWNKVLEGVYTGVSIGGRYVKKWDDPNEPGVKRYTAEPSEISLVDNPCIPTAHFQMVKAGGMTEQVLFKLYVPSNAEIEAETLAIKAKFPDASLPDLLEKARDSLLAKRSGETDEEDEDENGGDEDDSAAGAEPEAQSADTQDAIDEAEDEVDDDDDDAAGDDQSSGDTSEAAPKKRKRGRKSVIADFVKGAFPNLTETGVGSAVAALLPQVRALTSAKAIEGVAKAWKPDPADQDWGVDQVFQVRADNSVHAKKADALAHIDALKKVTSPTSAIAEAVAAALAKAKKSDDKPSGDYGDVKYADPGLQSDKKPRYPVDTPAHIRAAWSYINQSKNASQYSDGDLDKVKAAIVSAWKDKIDSGGPPSAEKMAAFGGPDGPAFLKALLDVRLAKGFWTVSSVAYALSSLADIMTEVCWEENAEHDDGSKLPQMANDAFNAARTLLVEMISEESGELMAALSASGATAAITLMEGAPPDLMALAAKATDLTKADTALLAKVGARNNSTDKATIQAIHDHAQDLGATCDSDNCDEADKSAPAALAKLTEERDAIQKAALEGIAEITASFEKRFADQDAQIAKLLAEPAPMPTLHIIGKADEAPNAGLGGRSQSDDELVVGAMKRIGLEGLQKLAFAASFSDPQSAVGRLSGQS